MEEAVEWGGVIWDGAGGGVFGGVGSGREGTRVVKPEEGRV